MEVIFKHLKDEPVVHATGYICRTAQAVADRPQNFYMIGSMGMASSIALGIALSRPGKKVVALDGDGAVLMNLGSLPSVGALKADNFIHIVIDNGCYESTGSQPSYSKTVKLEDIAKASGYRYARRVSTAAALKREMRALMTRKGPSFLLVRVGADRSAPAPRVTALPDAITRNFSGCLR